MANLKEIALRVVKNPAVRKAFVALVMAALAAAGVSVASGCAELPAPVVPQLSAEAQCVVDALSPVAGEHALSLAEKVLAGEDVYLESTSQEKLYAAVADLRACYLRFHDVPDAGTDL